MRRVVYGDNLPFLRGLPDGVAALIYIDPPFNTGRAQARTRLRTALAADGDRVGFGGRRYRTTRLAGAAYPDRFADYLGFLEPRLREAHRVLAPHGALYFHGDYREIHYCKVLLDGIFGRDSFLNEIVWVYDYGARATKRWPAKHDTILYYVKDPTNYVFNAAAVDREPYMAPGLVGPEKAARGKLPTDCFSADTDILTDRGWIPFSDLAPGDRVASVAPTGELVYAQPTQLHARHYRGEMCAFTTKTIDLLVTPNHRMYLRPKHAASYRFMPAREVLEAAEQRGASFSYALRNRLRWEGQRTTAQFQVPACDYERASCAKPLPPFDLGDWCEFLGLYLAAGSTTRSADCAETQLSQRNVENVPPIAALLRRMGLRFRYDDQRFTIRNTQLTLYLRQFGEARERQIPRELLELPREDLSRLDRGLLLGDGHERRNEGAYHTDSARLAGNVQELLLKLGDNATMSALERRTEQHPHCSTHYRVSRRTAHESLIFPARHARMVHYDGMVYCCTVEPHHTLVVRRNGKPAVCGNCWWHTIVSPTGKEKTGYPTQKPLGVLRRIITASSNPGDLVLDFFAGSGTTGAAAADLGRDFLLVDNNEAALIAMARRFALRPEVEFVGFDPTPHRGAE